MFAIYVTFIVNMDLGKYILASDILIGNFISFMNNFIHWVSYEKHLINPQSHWSPCNAFSFSQAGMLGYYRPGVWQGVQQIQEKLTVLQIMEEDALTSP